MGALATRQFFDTNVGSYLPMSRAAPEFGPETARQVREWRSLRASWQAIAGMLGCSEDKLRRQYDPAYVSPVEASTVAQTAAEAQTVKRVAMGGLQHEMLKRLAHGPMSEFGLARDLGCRRKDVHLGAAGLLSKQLISPFGQGDLQLTAAGLGELDRLRDVGARREPTARDESAQAARRRRVLLALLDGLDTTEAISRRIGSAHSAAGTVLGALSAAGEAASQRKGAAKSARWVLTPKGQAAAEALARV